MRSSRQFSFLNGPNKLVFVRMYESTFTGLVGPPCCYCSLVAFCAFFVIFYALLHAQKTLKSKNTLTKNNKKTNSKQQRQQFFARTNF